MNLYTNLKSDLYKIVHTPIWLLHLLIPLAAMMLFLSYYAISPWHETDKLSAYIQALAVVFPALIGIITSLLSELEQNAGSSILLTANAKFLPHASKILLLILLAMLSTLFALVGFGTAFIKMGYVTQNFLFYLETAVLLWASVLPLYLLHYIVSFHFGKGWSIGLGILGTLLSALFLTGLGDGIWPYLPWGITSRFAELLLISNLSDVPFLQYNDVIKSIINMLIVTSILTIIFVLSFNKWEGRQSED
ncbi:lantibiotic immunity ABC transporter MutG family permease subunit [Eubacteriaceae bacterium ES2]|nr:lantibiotic immunity ABC transporter MutG family permease subunit [Eubacteriaceae bacterium ES2]